MSKPNVEAIKLALEAARAEETAASAQRQEAVSEHAAAKDAFEKAEKKLEAARDFLTLKAREVHRLERELELTKPLGKLALKLLREAKKDPVNFSKSQPTKTADRLVRLGLATWRFGFMWSKQFTITEAGIARLAKEKGR